MASNKNVAVGGAEWYCEHAVKMQGLTEEDWVGLWVSFRFDEHVVLVHRVVHPILIVSTSTQVSGIPAVLY